MSYPSTTLPFSPTLTGTRIRSETPEVPFPLLRLHWTGLLRYKTGRTLREEDEVVPTDTVRGTV